jgi:hypothetical protein
MVTFPFASYRFVERARAARRLTGNPIRRRIGGHAHRRRRKHRSNRLRRWSRSSTAHCPTRRARATAPTPAQRDGPDNQPFRRRARQPPKRIVLILHIFAGLPVLIRRDATIVRCRRVAVLVAQRAVVADAGELHEWIIRPRQSTAETRSGRFGRRTMMRCSI